jgi:hypothetical protein
MNALYCAYYKRISNCPFVIANPQGEAIQQFGVFFSGLLRSFHSLAMTIGELTTAMPFQPTL